MRLAIVVCLISFILGCSRHPTRHPTPEDVTPFLNEAIRLYDIGDKAGFIQQLNQAIAYSQWKAPDPGMLRGVFRRVKDGYDSESGASALPCLSLSILARAANAQIENDEAIYYMTLMACFFTVNDVIKNCKNYQEEMVRLIKHFESSRIEFKHISQKRDAIGNLLYIHRSNTLARKKIIELNDILRTIK
jgi:hypothetical protein